MEVDRGGKNKVKSAVLDTNVLIYVFTQKVDILDQLRELGFKKFLIPDKVFEELKNLSISLTGKEKRAAKLAIKLIESCKDCEIVESNAVGTDDALLQVAKKFKATLITNDKNLRRRANEEGVETGYLREMKFVEIEEI
ncbi:Nucleotide binding protein PINc [Ferroglobus placidus DSM 10642]|uniref:Nucleotide binding protein PINc n=1 Tax=Ferroglobus placidus (strain DSM 10642 / AEDII12DO) TaxID=589924 RepID=D3RZ76_FERPA|nr:PIN domain-containing protein [Ferroglobus placidus]ADC65789.1 Nucleotide binding protein PINc [Ferroglobus placidus DSM 10642]